MAAPLNPDGRERRKYNSLKGGLSIPHILPCTEKCIYQDICPVYSMLVDGFTQETFISTCAIEAAQYLNLKNYYYNNPKFCKIDGSLIDELIMLEVRIERLRRFISLYPDMIGPNHQISKPYTLITRLKKKLINAFSHLLE